MVLASQECKSREGFRLFKRDGPRTQMELFVKVVTGISGASTIVLGTTD